MAQHCQKSEDQIILEEINRIIAIRATCGYRRVPTMMIRKRASKGRDIVNRKRVQRVMRMNAPSLPQIMPAQKREHTGVAMTLIPNLSWCSYDLEVRCFNNEKFMWLLS